MIKLLSTWRTWFEGQPQSEPAGKYDNGKEEKQEKQKKKESEK